MSNSWRAQVNQKLYFAQMLLNETPDKPQAALTALLEGAVFHLATAYRLYLREIAQGQRQNTDAVDARSARRQLAGQGIVCQALEELAWLEEDNLWPARLLAAYRESVGDTVKTAASKAAADTIVVADVTESPDVQSCQQWLEQFQRVIEIQRQSAEEW